MSEDKSLHVVAGVVSNPQGEILLARRSHPLEYYNDLWEFPGGKVEINEIPKLALIRELREELDIVVQDAYPLICVSYCYPDKKIWLDVWRVTRWWGNAWGKEGQLLEWCAIDQLDKKSFLAANYPVITAIKLPEWYLITPEPKQFKDKPFFYQLEACLDKGMRLVQLRAKNLGEREYCHCAERALTLCERHQAQLLVNATPSVALSVGARGVHLTSNRLLACEERPLPRHLWVAASCHNATEIQQAQRIQVDFLVVSPVQATPSHPDASILGWSQFAELVKMAHCPCFALGGMTIEDLPLARNSGAQGIAAIRALWK